MSLFDNPTTNTAHPHMSGEQRIYEFDNGFRASVIRGVYSYGGDVGLYELAVMDKDDLRYDTHITSDVVGCLTQAEVEEYLVRIKALEWSEPSNAGPGGPTED